MRINRINNSGKCILLISCILLICLISYHITKCPILRFITPDILPASGLDTKSANELEDLFHGYLKSTPQYTCHNKTRVGEVGERGDSDEDEGWFICEDVDYKPKPPCLTYSFGIGYDYTFDIQMKSKYGCEVHSFDPLALSLYLYAVNFHSIGLKDITCTVGGQKFMTLSDIRKHLNHSKRAIEILKMDIEGDEYPSLRKAIEDGELEGVKQLLIEFHVKPNQNTGAENIHRGGPLMLKQLIRNGFRIYHVDRDTTCDYISYKKEELTQCYIVYWLKVS